MLNNPNPDVAAAAARPNPLRAPMLAAPLVPNRSRRLLGTSLAVLMLSAALPLTAARADTFNIANGDIAALKAAIIASGTNGAPDTIVLATNGTYTLTTVDNTDSGAAGLPRIALDGVGTNAVTIQGNGASIVRSQVAGTPDFRLITVNMDAGLNVSDLTLSGGRSSGARGGQYGGAISTTFGKVTMTNCTISNNFAPTGGGGIFSSGTLELTNCTFSNNSAPGQGGALNLQNCMATLKNCTLSGNVSSDGGEGGAILNFAFIETSALSMDSCTLNNNTGVLGANIENQAYNGGTATTTYRNTIIAGGIGGVNIVNDGADGTATLTSLGNNIASDNSANLTQATDQPNTDPLLAPLGDYGGPTQTQTLLAGSPALNRGDTTLTVDQRGQMRPGDLNAAKDIGAVEVQSMPPTVSNFSLALVEDTTFTFAANSFDAGFSDSNEGDTLQSVRIVTLPANGTLNFNGQAVIANQEIARADLPNLTFVPASNFNGATSFDFNASDGRAFADNDATITLNVAAVNDAPSFTVGADQNVTINSGAQKVQGFATNISAGPADEAGQALTFVLTTDNPSLFRVQPTINSNGNLFYTLAPKASGTANVSVTLKDDGGTENGGVDTSAAQTFVINVRDTNIAFGVTLQPRLAFTNDTLTATPSNAGAKDIQFLYEYFVNNVRVQRGSRGSGNTLDLRRRGFGDKGDTIKVVVTATNRSNGDSGQATNSVLVSNSAPVAVGGTANAKSGVETLIALARNGAPGASDIDGDLFIYKRAGQPTNSTAFFETRADGSAVLHYTPNAGFIGTEDVKFYAVDRDGAYSNAATIRVTVSANGASSASAIQSGDAPSGGSS